MLDFNQRLFEAVSHILNEINPKHSPPGYATAKNALNLAVDQLNTCFSLRTMKCTLQTETATTTLNRQNKNIPPCDEFLALAFNRIECMQRANRHDLV